MAAHACSPTSQVTEAGGQPQVGARLGYTRRLSLKPSQVKKKRATTRLGIKTQNQLTVEEAEVRALLKQSDKEILQGWSWWLAA